MGGEFRLIFAHHRGQGGSDKPRETSAYALPTRVGDAVAVLDALGIERTHFLGSSWGAGLGYALGEHAPERVLSLVLCGNQPYAWNLESPTARAVSAAIAASRREGMKRFVETFEYRFPEPERTWTLEKTTRPRWMRRDDPATTTGRSRRASASGACRASSALVKQTRCTTTPRGRPTIPGAQFVTGRYGARATDG